MKISGRSGFTLIELLVTMSIVGVLSSIVLATIVDSRLKARDAAVKSTLAQMEVLLAQEYQDNGSYRLLQSKDWNEAPQLGDDCDNVFPPDSTTDVYGWGHYDPNKGCTDTDACTSKYKADMIKLCKELVKYSPVPPNSFWFSTLAGPNHDGVNYLKRYSVYSVTSRLPSTGKLICYGSNGKSVNADNSLAIGCPENPVLINM